jgi:GNAT superfamily N-acetyltransferase
MALTVQEERFHDVIEEARPLLERHWKEIALNQDFIELSPNYARYASMDAAKRLCIVTAREDGVLVGYACFFVDHSPHYSTILWGTSDIIWVAPEHRRNGTGHSLLEYAKATLAARGVCMLHVIAKLAHPALGHLLASMGFTPVETVFATVLQRPE